MNLIYYVLFGSLFSMAVSSTNLNCNNNLKKIGFKVVIFKRKEAPKLIKYLKDKLKFYYNKSMVTVAEGIIEYENMSYEDKQIIEFIASFLF